MSFLKHYKLNLLKYRVRPKMYRRNLQITIGKFSGKPNNPVRIVPIISSTPISATPGGARLLTLFIILPLFFLSGCDTSGSFVCDILPDEDLIATNQRVV